MSNENMTWQDVCRELLRLDAEGYSEPWRAFEICLADETWEVPHGLGSLLSVAGKRAGVRLKPRTVRVTTPSGEVLELPEPWWDARGDDEVYILHGDWSFVAVTANMFSDYIRAGAAFRTREDARAWADAMPRIRGRG